MSLIFLDSFDHYTTLTHKYVSATGGMVVSAGNGRYGTAGLRRTNNLGNVQLVVNAMSTFTMGFAWRWAVAGAGTGQVIAELRDGTTRQVELWIDGAGYLYVGRNSTQIGPYGSIRLEPNVWYFIEWSVVISDTVGTAQVRVNEQVALSGSSLDTKNTANASVTRMYIGRGDGSSTISAMDYDDIYLRDDGTFAGDSRVAAIRPSGAGTTTQQAPSAGSNFQCVDESAPNDDTDYVEADTVGEKDTYAMGDLPTTAQTVFGVIQRARMRKTDAAASTARLVVRSGGTDYESGDKALSDSYAYLSEIREVDPNTAAAWTHSAVNAMEAGQKHQA